MATLDAPRDVALTVSAAARLIGVSVSSLRAWAAAGQVPFCRTPGGHRRFLRSDLQSWLAERGGALPADHSQRPHGLRAGRVASSEASAAVARDHRDDVVAGAERLLEMSPLASRRASDARRVRLERALDDLANALESGDLGSGMRDAEWLAYRHGAGGWITNQPLGELLALTRSLERTVAVAIGSQAAVESVRRANDRLLASAAAGYAEGGRAREEALDAA